MHSTTWLDAAVRREVEGREPGDGAGIGCGACAAARSQRRRRAVRGGFRRQQLACRRPAADGAASASNSACASPCSGSGPGSGTNITVPGRAQPRANPGSNAGAKIDRRSSFGFCSGGGGRRAPLVQEVRGGLRDREMPWRAPDLSVHQEDPSCSSRRSRTPPLPCVSPGFAAKPLSFLPVIRSQQQPRRSQQRHRLQPHRRQDLEVWPGGRRLKPPARQASRRRSRLPAPL